MNFQSDIEFLQKYTNIILLRNGLAAVAVAPAYQGRVMTSTFEEESGPSFGWINRPVISQGILSESERKGTLQEHIHVFGGEERFWMGPEGGQYALFFKPGVSFDFNNWKTPAAIDTDSYEVVAQQEDSVSVHHVCDFRNYSGTHFLVGIDRTVSMLQENDLEVVLGQKVPQGLEFVGYKSDNRITNRGKEPWDPESGLLSIWILGMYKPVAIYNYYDSTFVPKKRQTHWVVSMTHTLVQSPPDCLYVRNNTVFFRGDGQRRGKIGVGPKWSKGVAGSYDAVGKVLTLVSYDVKRRSRWLHQFNVGITGRALRGRCY